MSSGGCLSSATLQGLVVNVHGLNDVGSSSPHLNLAVLASHAEHLVLVAVQAHVAHTLGRATTDGGREARAVVGGVPPKMEATTMECPAEGTGRDTWDKWIEDTHWTMPEGTLDEIAKCTLRRDKLRKRVEGRWRRALGPHPSLRCIDVHQQKIQAEARLAGGPVGATYTHTKVRGRGWDKGDEL